MSAEEKVNISKLGIIAGGGSLPQRLVETCNEQDIEPFLVCYNGYTSQDLPQNYQHIWTRLGAAGQVIDFFRDNNVCDLVLIGNISRPSLKNIVPDWRGVKILSRIGGRILGDSSLLSLLKDELENDGFRVYGIQDFCDDLLMGEGQLGAHGFEDISQEAINLGLEASQQLGRDDVGQSVIVQNNLVVGREDKNGTDALILRCADLLKDHGKGGILVKTCKPQQDRSLDLPTIGLKTIENAHQVGLSGIVLHANHVILTDRKAITEYADRCKIFVVGIALPENHEAST